MRARTFFGGTCWRRFALVIVMFAVGVARAEPPDSAGPPPTGPGASAASPKPAPYSLPWQLRPAAAVNVVRWDSTLAFYGIPGVGRGVSVFTSVLASYKVTPHIAPFVRAAVIYDSVATGTAVTNPLVGVAVASKPQDWRWAGVLALAIPVATGAGYPVDPADAARKALPKGVSNRSAMDNALFAGNDLTPVLGGDIAFVKYGLTVQLEATLLFLNRVRVGLAAQPDAFKLNSTFGLHAGYFVLPMVSLAGELRWQRWLVPPAAIRNATNNDTWELVSQATFAIGARGHFQLGPVWLRPGLSYSRGFDAPMSAAPYDVVQLDVPILF